jgi:hypothetical protein
VAAKAHCDRCELLSDDDASAGVLPVELIEHRYEPEGAVETFGRVLTVALMPV